MRSLAGIKKLITSRIVDEVASKILVKAALPKFAQFFNVLPGFFMTLAANFLSASPHFPPFLLKTSPSPSACTVLSLINIASFLLLLTQLHR